MNIQSLYDIYTAFPSVQTDTRKLKKGDLFFALRGEHFDGNQFAEQALERGAEYAIVDAPISGNPRIIVVDDVLSTLQQLAKYHRQQFDIPFIAITGSNGKTTTKELIHAVLSSTYTTYTTEGNLNNHIGIPLTLLRVKRDAAFAVVEMGANHQREIAGYCTYVLPTHGLITNAGKAHLEGFGGEEGVKKGKGELFDFLRTSNGSAFVMWDYPYLREMSQGIREIIRYGTSGAAMNGQLISSDPFLSVHFKDGAIGDVQTHLVGTYNLPNILAAACVGNHFGVPSPAIRAALEGYIPSNSRSQLLELDSNKIILDAYNANPSSMTAAIENFSRIPSNNKVLILGGMAELGDTSLQEHERIRDLIGQYPWQQVVLVGGDFLKIEHPYLSFNNSAQAADWFRTQDFHDAYLLVKGSRSMQMEKVIAR